jgi:hypothetical protein
MTPVPTDCQREDDPALHRGRPRRLGRSFLPRVLVDGDRERGRSVSEDGRDDHRVHTSAARLRGHRLANVMQPGGPVHPGPLGQPRVTGVLGIRRCHGLDG